MNWVAFRIGSRPFVGQIVEAFFADDIAAKKMLRIRVSVSGSPSSVAVGSVVVVPWQAVQVNLGTALPFLSARRRRELGLA